MISLAKVLIGFCGLLFATGFFASGSWAQDSQAITMRLSAATVNDAQHEWMKRFAVAIERNTGGRIKAELYPGSQLGSIPRQIEGTQLGAIQCWLGPPEFLVGIDRRFEILSAPGLFQDEKQALKVFDDVEFNKAFLSLGANKGLIGASLFYVGPSSYDMRMPVRHIADLKDKKIRVLASEFQTESLALLGATGVPLSLGDVLPALQQGAIDGAYGAVNVFTPLKYFDAAKYMLETRQAYFYSVEMLSKKWFDALPTDLQSQVMTTSKQMASEVIPWGVDFVEQQRKTWVANGGEIIHLPDDEFKELMRKTRPVGDDIVNKRPELKPLWDMIVAISGR
jgi:TRAP-type C4-dicarboxylate transport system substrate-binding protein